VWHCPAYIFFFESIPLGYQAGPVPVPSFAVLKRPAFQTYENKTPKYRNVSAAPTTMPPLRPNPRQIDPHCSTTMSCIQFKGRRFSMPRQQGYNFYNTTVLANNSIIPQRHSDTATAITVTIVQQYSNTETQRYRNTSIQIKKSA